MSGEGRDIALSFIFELNFPSDVSSVFEFYLAGTRLSLIYNCPYDVQHGYPMCLSPAMSRWACHFHPISSSSRPLTVHLRFFLFDFPLNLQLSLRWTPTHLPWLKDPRKVFVLQTTESFLPSARFQHLSSLLPLSSVPSSGSTWAFPQSPGSISLALICHPSSNLVTTHACVPRPERSQSIIRGQACAAQWARTLAQADHAGRPTNRS